MSQPLYPPPTHQQQMPPAPQTARNGLGTAALVLGIIGTVSGLPMLTFWLAAPLGVLALVFGLVGRSRTKKGTATNKGVALAGLILGVVTLLVAGTGAWVTVFAVHEAGKAANEAVDELQGQPQDSAGHKSPHDLAPGAAATYNNGVKVTVSEPTPYTVDPATLISGHTDGNKAYMITVTLKNTGSEPFDKPMAGVKARAGGRSAEEIDDDKHGLLHDNFGDVIDAGDSASVEMVFDVPPNAEELSVSVSPDLMMKSVSWKLPL